jgi:Uma2 family endonuclease
MSSLATFTLDEYQHMVACGAFVGPNEKRLELIRGELRILSPQGAAHAEMVAQLNDWSHSAVDPRRIRIRIQSSVELPSCVSQGEPDVVWAAARSYARRLPRPSDILLLMEVADSSLAFDLGEKLQLYGEAGVPKYWVVDIPNRQVHIFRNPQAGEYDSRDIFRCEPGVSIAPRLVPEAVLWVPDLFRCLEV